MFCKQETFDSDCIPKTLKIPSTTPLPSLFPHKLNPKGFVGMWFVRAKKPIIIVVKLSRICILTSM
jgi:hypothetical protein